MGNSLEFGGPVRPHSDYNGTPPDLWPALAMREVVRNPRISDTALLSRENQPPPSRSAFCAKRALNAAPSGSWETPLRQIHDRPAETLDESISGLYHLRVYFPHGAPPMVNRLPLTVGFARVSQATEDQGNLETQTQRLQEYGVHELVTEIGSGAKSDR